MLGRGKRGIAWRRGAAVAWWTGERCFCCAALPDSCDTWVRGHPCGGNARARSWYRGARLGIRLTGVRRCFLREVYIPSHALLFLVYSLSKPSRYEPWPWGLHCEQVVSYSVSVVLEFDIVPARGMT